MRDATRIGMGAAWILVAASACGGASPSTGRSPTPSSSASIPAAQPAPIGVATNARPAAASAPVTAAGRAPPVVRQIAARNDVTCAVAEGGALHCWGDNQFDVIGAEARENSRPVRIETTGPVVQVAVGQAHACLRYGDGTMACWGSNYSGELGQGQPTTAPGVDVTRPTLVPGLRDVTAISTYARSAAILADRTVMFWGDFDIGAGDPRRAGAAKPARVVGIRDAEEVVDASASTCARLAGGSVRCWFAVSPALIPRGKDRIDPVVAPVKGAVALFTDNAVTCAVTRGGAITCWTGRHGLRADPYPGLEKRTDIADIAFGSGAACARSNAGTVVCEEQDGTGTGTGRVEAVLGLSNVTQVVAGGRHFCALAAGRVLCWGVNDWGQLGDGTTTARKVPTPVAWP